jgi:hypothetical protein
MDILCHLKEEKAVLGSQHQYQMCLSVTSVCVLYYELQCCESWHCYSLFKG